MNKSRRVAFVGFGSARNGEQGLTLVEIIVAMAILAAAAVVFLVGMTTSSKAVMVSQERVAVDSLAKSQMEFIKSQDYVNTDDYNPSDPDFSYQPIAISTDLVQRGYEIIIHDPEAVPDGDVNIQSITIEVTRNGETAFTLIGYKVNQEE
ncbi:MAG: prepilin-type N-terminal cleavage/methylation domain-containing protein [Dehalococcoidia bacterium]|nr:prepilin-type N-terminal cleavage/methylation domain-containing protein [Dehalococcoidia bacterium]